MSKEDLIKSTFCCDAEDLNVLVNKLVLYGLERF